MDCQELDKAQASQDQALRIAARLIASIAIRLASTEATSASRSVAAPDHSQGDNPTCSVDGTGGVCSQVD